MEQTDMAEEEGAVRALYQQMTEAWNRGETPSGAMSRFASWPRASGSNPDR